MTWVNAIVQGLLLGGLYALFACGLSLMFGVMRIINLAHGDIAVLGAFLVWEAAHTWHLSPFVALLPVLPVMLIVGYLL
jgi:branched-chain amino acid transport system permease protein